MKAMRFIFTLCALIGAFFAGAPAFPADQKAAPRDLILKGDAKCTACHDEADAPEKLAIAKTRHGTVADSRTPSCTHCHGESQAHVANPQGTKTRPLVEVVFAGKQQSPPDAKNAACTGCHRRDDKRSHWEGSTHQLRDVACTSCHEMHTARDRVRDKRTQFEVCVSCHKEQRAQLNRPSRHPILEGKVACSDCHNSHGSVGPKLMKRDSVVETCYTCHMEKRGPFVHNHEPVAEDCSNCHNPHGTVAESMLKVRPPFLCHQCHTPHGPAIAQLQGQRQPATMLSATTSGKSGIPYTQGRGCLNCHTQIHGSNNPAATNPTPQFFLR